MKFNWKKKSGTPGKRKPGNRTLVGILCILAAVIVCFGVAPILNRSAAEKAEIVRVRQTVRKGSLITDADVEMVEVGAFHLPETVIREKEQVVGMYAAGDLYEGTYLLPGQLTANRQTVSDLLGSLSGGQKAISVSIDSFAQGLSGKLETGDIISIIVYASEGDGAFVPPELTYVKVITATTSQGVDKADLTDSSQPVSVTLLVNGEQAELLAQYEQTESMHFVLEYRGDAETAQKYLDVQNRHFADRTHGEA